MLIIAKHYVTFVTFPETNLAFFYMEPIVCQGAQMVGRGSFNLHSLLLDNGDMEKNPDYFM